MNKIIYIEERRDIYSETFVSSEKEKLKKLGYNIQDIYMSEFKVNFNKVSYQSIKLLIDGVKLAFHSLPNIKRFVSNMHAVLVVFFNYNAIKIQMVGATEVRAHFLAKRCTVAYLLSNSMNIPFTAVAHAADIFEWDSSINNKIKKAKRIDCISNFNVGYLCAKSKFKYYHKFHLIRNSFKDHAIAHDSAPSSGEFVFLLVARLIPKKGVIKAIELVKNYNQLVGLAKLKIIGDGPLQSDIRNYIMNNNLNNIVELMGKKNIDAVYSEMSISNAVILLSERATSKNTDMDGIPTVFFEALSMSKPVITTEVSGIPELIIDGFNGVIVDHKSTDEIMEKIKCSSKLIRSANNFFSNYQQYDVSRFY